MEVVGDGDRVVGEGSGDFDSVFALDGDPFEEFVGGGFAELVFVFEDDEGARSHAASGAGGGLVELEGVLEGGEEEFEVVVGKASLFGEEGVDEAMATVESVGDGELAAHFSFFFIDVSESRDGVFAGNYRVDRP